VTTHYRTVKGTGRYGVAYGGLNGDGDVVLCLTDVAAREMASKFFRNLLNPDPPLGLFVKTQFVTKASARLLLEGVGSQITDWKSERHGDICTLDLDLEPAPIRCAIFKLWFGPDVANPNGPSFYWIPPEIGNISGSRRIDGVM